MKSQNSALTLLLIVFLACAAIMVASLFLPIASGGSGDDGGAITIKLSGSPYVEGNIATVRAVSACGDFLLFLDGKKIGEGAPYFESPLPLAQGSHLLFAESESCNASFSFEAIARECSGNQTAPCEAGGCTGILRCANGIYSDECSIPKKVCIPGEKIGCSTDGCKFGYAICNQCGTGFGECGNGGAISSGNSNATCSEGGCG